MIKKVILLLCAITIYCNATNNQFLGRVVSITDGDTLGVIDSQNRYLKIRLAEIDAPEKKQDYGQVSKTSLSNICFNKIANISVKTTDRYGRLIANVICNGINANMYQVQNGMAWVYRSYSNNQSLLYSELNARKRKLGLWSLPNQVAPWDFRHTR